MFLGNKNPIEFVLNSYMNTSKNPNKNMTKDYLTKEHVVKMHGEFEGRKISTWEKLHSTYSADQVASKIHIYSDRNLYLNS